MEGFTTSHTVDRDLCDGVRTAFALQKTASPQPATVDAKDRENLTADKATIDNDFHKHWEVIQTSAHSVQRSLHEKVRTAYDLGRERVSLLVSKDSLEHQLQ